MRYKALTTLLLIIYSYTSLLPVHAFAMHASPNINNHHQESVEDCGHPQPDHDHSSHSEDNSKHGNMSECIDQGKGTVTDDTIVFSQHVYIPYILSSIDYGEYVVYNELYTFLLHDPGRGDNASFNKFLMSHYGETVLHC